MSSLLTDARLPLVAAGLFAVALAVASWMVLVPSRTVPVRRRRPEAAQGEGVVSSTAARATAAMQRALGRGSRSRRWAYALDRAGIRLDVAEFVLAVGITAVSLLFVGGVLVAPVLGFILAILVAGGTGLFVAIRGDRRKHAFADALHDVVQLMATNLRAGHSLLQTLDSVAREMDDPVRTELARAVNQVRLGRDLGDALEETANRMASEDFRWVAQAIGIHRQVGGNLANVLDTVAQTMRDRAQLRRQVRTLSAEGRLSAWILTALPVFVAGAMSLINPDYIGVLTGSPIGLAMLGFAVVLLIAGALWLRKVVEVRY